MTVDAATTTAAMVVVVTDARLRLGLAALKNQLQSERAVASLSARALEQARQAASAAGNGRRLDILV